MFRFLYSISLFCAIAAIFTLPISSTAQPAYPSRPITLIVPYPPGGGIDPAARIYADALEKALGQTIVIQNQGGASGQIGTNHAAHSSPNGYTLLFGSVAPNVILPAAYGNQLPYNEQKDFAPIGLIAQADYVLLVSAKLHVNSLKGFLDYAKAQTKPIAYASSGQLSGPHLAGALLSNMSGIKMLHVPYRGNGPALTALMSGEVAFAFDSAGGVVSRGKSDKYHALAVTGDQPFPSDPSLPNLGKLYPGHNVSQWYGLMAPAGIPQNVLDRLKAAHEKAVHSAALQRRMQEIGLNVITDSTPQKFQAYVDNEITRWRHILATQKIGIPKL
ncbi:Bug family tripartite tricarboxylate transporter substrate binding protein [Candidimonas nitroreducens]|nr:tripartite tricarboxylate transporter substrate binding protein [Candidimonas nitroreducens]